ncbi:DUF2625 family protein [Lentzea sp. JNUCC 0626]|uniref:DUF2625 family protein n=1 Tax=Lentzea sp. JNUCC 0626 TaxID=3367513 RepID=UPI0037481DC7
MWDITELTDVDDPGWPLVLEAVAEGSTSCVVLPPDADACRSALLQLQVTARSLLGAVVLNSGGLVLADGWLRVYGGSGGAMASSSGTAWTPRGSAVPVSRGRSSTSGRAVVLPAVVVEGREGGPRQHQPQDHPDA